MNLNKLTVALVCYQEKEQMSHILEDLKNQTAFKNIGEVLIFQNGNCSKTLQTAKSFLNQLPLKIFSSSLNHLGKARASLVEKSQYDLIAWTDSDCRLPKHWLEKLISQWKNKATKETLAIGGPNRLPETKLWQKILNLSLSHPLGHGWSPQAWKPHQAQKVSHIPTTNGLYLKKGILSAGNFSEKFPFSGEDAELGFRLNQKGELLLLPSPLVINRYAKNYGESLKRLFIFGTSVNFSWSWILLARFLFVPLFISCLILGFFQKIFFLIPLFYFFILCLASLFVGLKHKTVLSLSLPLFWFLQHFFYSTGTFIGILHKLKLKKSADYKKIT